MRRSQPWRGEVAPLYTRIGRPSLSPGKLLGAMLLQAFYSVRSERQLMERLDYDLLFQWFVDRGIDDPAWDHSTFSQNATSRSKVTSRSSSSPPFSPSPGSSSSSPPSTSRSMAP